MDVIKTAFEEEVEQVIEPVETADDSAYAAAPAQQQFSIPMAIQS